MSSFIVSQQCMNNVINGLFWNHEFKIHGRHLLEKNGYAEAKDFQRLGDELYDLNHRGTGIRYDDKNLLMTTTKFVWKDKTPNKYQVLKSMHCLRYQCNEGDNDEQPLYKFLCLLIDLWTNYVIDGIPMYQKAKWD